MIDQKKEEVKESELEEITKIMNNQEVLKYVNKEEIKNWEARLKRKYGRNTLTDY